MTTIEIGTVANDDDATIDFTFPITAERDYSRATLNALAIRRGVAYASVPAEIERLTALGAKVRVSGPMARRLARNGVTVAASV